MFRFPLIATATLLATVLSATFFATPAEAKQLVISGSFSATELFPDAVADMRRGQQMINNARQWHPVALRRGDYRSAQQLVAQFNQGTQLYNKGANWLRRVGSVRVTTLGDTSYHVDQAGMIRVIRGLLNAGTTVRQIYFWVENGRLRWGGSAPRNWDRSASRSGGGSGRRVAPPISGLRPIPRAPSTDNGGLFGLGHVNRRG